MENFGTRVKRLREEKLLTQKELARLVGISQATIGFIETGKNSGSKYAHRIAEVLGTTPYYLMEGREGAQSYAAIPDGLVIIPEVSIRAKAGIDGFAIQDVYANAEESVVLTEKFIREAGLKPGFLKTIRVQGNSMEPTFQAGDKIMIDTQPQTPIHNKVYLVNYEGEIVLKRFFAIEGEWYLRSDNSDKARYPDIKVTSRTFIIGRVLYCLSASF